jgi:hypothetical protein
VVPGPRDARRARCGTTVWARAGPARARAARPICTRARASQDLDLARTFPGHRLLATPDGAARLRSVLLAYARRHPRVGYVQGMGFVAALLLVFLEEPEDAFWTFAAVVELLLPRDFFYGTLFGLRVEQSAFHELVGAKLPRVARLLHAHGVVAELFVTRWFVALFANSLPPETTLRVWDAFLLEGTKVLHRVGLALLRVAEPRLLACADQHELLWALQEEPARCLDVERLLSLAFDRGSFLRSFSRSRIHALRRKHRARLLLAEQPPLVAAKIEREVAAPIAPPAQATAATAKAAKKPSRRSRKQPPQPQPQPQLQPPAPLRMEDARDEAAGGEASGGVSTSSASSSSSGNCSGGPSPLRVAPDCGEVEADLEAYSGRSPRSTLLTVDAEAAASSDDEGQEDDGEGGEADKDDEYEILSADDLPPRQPEKAGWLASRLNR